MPPIRSACEGNAEPIGEGFAFLLDAKVNNHPSYLVPRLACRQFPADEMANQWGRNIHGVPCLYLIKTCVAHHVGIKEGGVYIARESTVHGACRERHYRAGLPHVGRQPSNTGHRSHYDVASRPKCPIVPGGGGAADTGVIPSDRVDQAEAAGVVTRVKTKG